MTITIVPFTISSSCDSPPQLVGYGKEKHTKGNNLSITYWGIYLDDRYVSYTSNKELAEKTKLWIEKWLKNKF